MGRGGENVSGLRLPSVQLDDCSGDSARMEPNRGDRTCVCVWLCETKEALIIVIDRWSHSIHTHHSLMSAVSARTKSSASLQQINHVRCVADAICFQFQLTSCILLRFCNSFLKTNMRREQRKASTDCVVPSSRLFSLFFILFIPKQIRWCDNLTLFFFYTLRDTKLRPAVLRECLRVRARENIWSCFLCGGRGIEKYPSAGPFHRRSTGNS